MSLYVDYEAIRKGQTQISMSNPTNWLILFQLFTQIQSCSAYPPFGFIRPNDKIIIKLTVPMSNDTHMQLDVKYWLSDKPQIQKILQYVIPFGEQKKGRLLKMSSEVWGPNNKKEYADELRLKMKQ